MTGRWHDALAYPRMTNSLVLALALLFHAVGDLETGAIASNDGTGDSSL